MAQTQMRYLPMQDKYIDFGQAGTSSNVVSLPTHNPGYQGEKPSYCQQIVYDRNSNNNQILFFICDNHIYNKYGKPMWTIDTSIEAKFFNEYYGNNTNNLSDIIENPQYANLKNTPIGNIEQEIDDGIITSTSDIVLSPKIIVAPVPGSCYDFFVILSIYTLEGADGRSQNDLFLFKIKYLNEDEIEFSKYFTLAQYIPEITGQSNGVSINAALSDYRSSTNDYILAVNVSKKLYTFNLHGSIDFDNPSTNISQISSTTLCSSCGDLEENFKEEAEIIPIYSHGQLNKYRVAYSIFDTYSNPPKIRFYVTELNTSGSITNSYYFTEDYFCGTSCHNTPKGLEFSPNGTYLYYTWTGQSLIRYVNIPSLISGAPETTYKQTLNIGSDNATYYKYSHIELGRDGKLYYIRTTGDGSTNNATLSTFSNPNYPTSGTWTSNVLSINNLKMQHYISSSIYPMEGDRNKYKHYVISDQLDGSNYENYYNTINSECCLEHFAYNLLNTSFNSKIVKKDQTSEDDYDIEVQNGYTGTWTATSNPFNTGGGNTVYLKRSLYVDAGATLTINGLIIKFQEGEGMYLLPGSGTTKGARVTFTNTKLTAMDACSNNVMWQGVSVIGNWTNQLPNVSSNTQTKLIMGSGSIIEYAEVGVHTEAGGIIQANSVTFRDNIYAVGMGGFINSGSYSEQNASYFYSCIFKTDNDLYNLKNRVPIYLVNIWENHGLVFTQCQFLNTSSQPFGVRGFGLNTNLTNLIVRGTCNSSTVPCPYADQTPTLFQGLDWGFKAQIGTSIEAQKCKFDNNFKGLYIQAYNGNVKVLENYFNTATSTPDTTYGLYLFGCPYYKVEENKFENGKAGMFVNNCHIQVTGQNNYNNCIYRNTFNNLSNSSNAVAVTALNYNNDRKYGIGDYGTIIKCNTFTNSKYNISVLGTSTNLAGIRHNQGDGGTCDTCPANNYFDHVYCSSFPQSDFYVTYSNINKYVYYYPRLGGNNYKLQCYSTSYIDTNGVYVTPSCPTHLSSGGGGSSSSMGSQYNAMLSTDESIETSESELNNLVDNGNTPALLSGLSATLTSSNTYNELMQTSPYLSDTVLSAVMLGSGLNPVQKRNVVTACSPLPLSIRPLIENMNIAAAAKASLWALQNGTNAREEKESELHALHAKRGEILKNLLGNAFNSTTPGTIDTLCTILQNEKGFNEKLIYIQLLINKNELNNASNAINQIRGLADNYTGKEKQEMLDMLDLMSIMLECRQAGDSPDSLKKIVGSHQKFLTSIASQPSHGGNSLAHALLTVSGIQNVKELILLPEPGNNQKKRINVYPPSGQQTSLKIYPVPALDELSIESDEELTGTIEIINSTGNVVKQTNVTQSKKVTISVSDLPNGIYMLHKDNTYVKFSIIR